MSKHDHSLVWPLLVGVLLLGTQAIVRGGLTADVAGAPTCSGLTATVYVNVSNTIVGGPDVGKTYAGTLNGTSGADVIVGTDGGDTINGKQGGDVICGGGGADVIGGDYGNDVLFGESGNDTVNGNQDDDQVDGGDGDDTLTGGYGSDTLHGGGGNDTMEGNQEADQVFGDAGNDTLDGGYGTDVLCGNGDDDVINGRQNDDQLDGGPGTDTLDGDTGTDVCRNGETTAQCEDAAPGLVAACGDGSTSSSSSVSSSATSSSSSNSASDVSSSSSFSSSSSSFSSSSTSSSSAQTSSQESSSSSSSSREIPPSGGDVQAGNQRSPTHRHAGGSETEIESPIFRGRGLAELAAVTHAMLARYGLHSDSPYKYTFHHEEVRPKQFASHEAATDWTLRAHAACCSIYRYLARFRESAVSIKPGYIDWVSAEVARALGEDLVDVRAALLGLPHAHPHTNDLLQDITAAGCTENPYVYGATPSEEQGHSAHMEHLAGPGSPSESLTIRPEQIPNEIAFAVVDGDAVFTDFGVSHTKEMHLLVVRDDLRSFQHLHPARDADGLWRIPFIPPAPGTYWMYADFVGSDDKAHTIRFERTYEGDPGEYGVAKDLRPMRHVGKYLVQLTAARYEQGMLFTVTVRDEQYGDTARLEQYLGALGHGIILAPDGAFIHTHPSPAGDDLVFHTPVLSGEFYRMFVQFQIAGDVHTVAFDWEQ